MAVQVYKPTREPNEVLQMFARQSEEALRKHFRVQRIWPFEVYPGYIDKLEEHDDWQKPTGQAYKSISVTSRADKSSASLTLSFVEHLRFVDMGTMWQWVEKDGKMRRRTLTFEEVQHEKPAKPDRRYVNNWVVATGETHRPILMMETRHLQARMTNYYQDYWGKELVFNILETVGKFDDLNITL